MRKIIGKIAHKILPFHFVMYFRYRYFNTRQNRQDKVLRKRFYSQFINSGDLVFDIGANLGNRIETFLGCNARVIAVEPQEKCVKYLSLMYGKNIEVVQKGVSDSSGKAKMYISSSNALSSFSKEWIEKVNSTKRFGTHTWHKEIEIDLITFDQLIEKFGTPHFAKIDVEGFEYNVFKGLSKPINYVSFEYAVPENLDGLLECTKRLFEINNEVKFNYSIGESMKLALERWLPYKEMIPIINGSEFLNSNFGDIYAKN